MAMRCDRRTRAAATSRTREHARRTPLRTCPRTSDRWSPDGARLVVAGYRAGSIRLYLVNADGGGYRLGPQQQRRNLPTFSAGRHGPGVHVFRPGSAARCDGSARDLEDGDTGRRPLNRNYEMLTPLARWAPVRRRLLLTGRLDDADDTRPRRGSFRHRCDQPRHRGQSRVVAGADRPGLLARRLGLAFIRERSTRAWGD